MPDVEPRPITKLRRFSRPGRLLSLTYSHPQTLKPHNTGFDPVRAEGLFYYRRIVNRKNFAEGTYAGDVTLVNWPQNDYLLGNICGADECNVGRADRRAAG